MAFFVRIKTSCKYAYSTAKDYYMLNKSENQSNEGIHFVFT